MHAAEPQPTIVDLALDTPVASKEQSKVSTGSCPWSKARDENGNLIEVGLQMREALDFWQ